MPIGGKGYVQQKFKLNFVNKADEGKSFGRSGNPGYFEGLPLLVA